MSTTAADIPKYTLCVPGKGKCQAATVPSLRIHGTPLDILVQQALQNNNTVWLDVIAATSRDIHALSQIFHMSPDISRELWQHSCSQQSTIAQCRRTPSELYLTWVETLADASSISTYCSTGTPGDSAHVPDWLDSRAKGRQLFTGMSLLQMAHRIRTPASEKGQMSKQVDVHVAERATRLLQLLEQVAAKRKHAAACIRDLQTELGRQRFAAKQHGRIRRLAPPAPATNELVKTQVIQMWVSGPIVLTIRPRSSYTWATDRVLSDASLLHAAHVTPDSIVQLILNSSIHATSDCLSQLTQICNQAAYELSQPAVSSIHEA
ncbi:hypothetical protein H4S07_003824, partial [Coemansia furcata]